MAKTKNVILISLATIFVIGIIVVIFYMGLITQTAGRISTVSVTCKDDHRCDATPVLDCKTSSGGDRQVIFRSEGSYGTGYDLAYAQETELGFLPLKSYTNVGSGSSSQPPARNTCRTTPEGWCITDALPGSQADILIWSRNGGSAYHGYKLGGNADLISIPKFNCQNLETCSGTQESYSCSKEVFIDGVSQGFLSYSKNVPTPTEGITGETYYLISGQRLDFNGRIIFNEEFSQEPLNECEVDTAQGLIAIRKGESVCKNSNTLVTCIDPPQTTSEFKSPQITTNRCVNGVWTEAYTVSVVLEETIISLGDDIKINFDLNDPQFGEGKRNVVVELFDGYSREDSDSGLTNDGGQVSLMLTPTTTGAKTIKVFMDHPEGDYNPEPIEIRVTEALEITTFKTLSPQFDNEDIIVRVEVTKGNEFKNMVDWDIDDSYNGRPVLESSVKQLDKGIYEFHYQLKGDGLLEFRIRGEDETGFKTDWNPIIGDQEVNVKIAQILFTNENYPFSVCSGRSHTSTFKLVDNSGNNLEGVSTTIKITDPDGDVTTITAQDKGDGKYSFSNVYLDGGNYFLDIEASKGDLRGLSENNPVNILSCSGSGGVGVGGDEGGIDLVLLGGVLALVLSIGTFIYFVFGRKK